MKEIRVFLEIFSDLQSPFLGILRCKNHFKLGQSEFVAPEIIEGLLQSALYRLEIVDSRMKWEPQTDNYYYY